MILVGNLGVAIFAIPLVAAVLLWASIWLRRESPRRRFPGHQAIYYVCAQG